MITLWSDFFQFSVLVKVKKIDRNQIANCRAIGNAMERVEREWRCANGNGKQVLFLSETLFERWRLDPFPFCDIEPEHIIPAFRLHHFRILCKLALLPKDLLGPNQQVRDQTVATFRTIEYIEGSWCSLVYHESSIKEFYSDLHEHETTSSEADLRDTSVVQHSNATTWNVKPSSNHKRCQQSDGTKKELVTASQLHFVWPWYISVPPSKRRQKLSKVQRPVQRIFTLDRWKSPSSIFSQKKR